MTERAKSAGDLRGPGESVEERLEGGGYRRLVRRGRVEMPRRGSTVPELVAAVEWLIDWREGEIGQWWPGEFRTLTLTRALPHGRTFTMTCRSLPIDHVLRITIGNDMAPGEPGYVDPANNHGVMTLFYYPGLAGTMERLLDHADQDARELARHVLTDLQRMVRVIPVDNHVDFVLHEGSRLPEMPVFEGIHAGELVTILRESGYEGAFESDMPDTDIAGRHMLSPGLEGQFTRPRAIVVAEPTPFDIRLADNDETGWGTAIFSAALAGDVTPEMVNNLNALLPVGCAWRRDDGVVLLRYNLHVTGGLSHAAIRNRIDEWMEGLELAARVTATTDGDRTDQT